MKTLFFCLLMFSYAEIGKSTTNFPKPGGVSVLTVNPAASSIDWRAEKTTGKHNGTIKIQSGSLTFYCQQLAKGSITIDMNSIVVSDLEMPDKQKLENNLKVIIFLMPVTILRQSLRFLQWITGRKPLITL